MSKPTGLPFSKLLDNMTTSDYIAIFAALISIISLAGTVYAVFFDMAQKRSERYAEIERDLPEVAFPL
jgi:hypothetical protein